MIALLVAGAFLGTASVVVDENSGAARVYAVDRAQRIVTLVAPSGESAAVLAPPGMPGFDLVQPGATVEARWTEPEVLSIEKPDAPAPPAGTALRLALKSGRPTDVVAPLRASLGVIKAIDPVLRLISFAPQNGAAFTAHVPPEIDLGASRVGDAVVLDYAPAMLLSAAPKSP